MYNFLSFNQCLHPCSHYHNQDMKHQRPVHLYPFAVSPFPNPAPCNHSYDFYHSKFILSDLKIHINWIIQQVVSCVWYFYCNQASIFWESFTLYVAVVWSFSWPNILSVDLFMHLPLTAIWMFQVFGFYEQSWPTHLYIVHVCFGGHIISFVWVKYLGVEFLDYMVYAYKLLGICLILYKIDKQFYDMIASFYISSGISSSQWLSKAEAVNFGANQFINIFLMVYEVSFITKESLPSLRDKVYLMISSRSSLVLALTFRCKSF